MRRCLIYSKPPPAPAPANKVGLSPRTVQRAHSGNFIRLPILPDFLCSVCRCCCVGGFMSPLCPTLSIARNKQAVSSLNVLYGPLHITKGCCAFSNSFSLPNILQAALFNGYSRLFLIPIPKKHRTLTFISQTPYPGPAKFHKKRLRVLPQAQRYCSVL